MKNLDKCQQAYDAMEPSDELDAMEELFQEGECLGVTMADVIERAIEEHDLDALLAHVASMGNDPLAKALRAAAEEMLGERP